MPYNAAKLMIYVLDFGTYLLFALMIFRFCMLQILVICARANPHMPEQPPEAELLPMFFNKPICCYSISFATQVRILAEQSGVVNVISSLVTGDMISAGKPFATIIFLNEGEFKVQLYVNNSDIANIDVGDTVKYNLQALPSNQYGKAEGIVRNISTDSLVQDGQFSGYYLVESSIVNKEFSDKDGNIGSVAIGM